MTPTPDLPMSQALTPAEHAQIVAARSSAASVVCAARDLIVEDQDQAIRAGEILRDLATVRKRAECERKGLTEPYREKVAQINAQYKEPSSMLDEADKTIRAKIREWNVEQERQRAIRQAELDAEAERQRKADEAERDRLAAEAREQSAAWEAEEARRRADAEANPSPEAQAAADAAKAAHDAMAALEQSRAIVPLPVREVEQVKPAKVGAGVSSRKVWCFEITDESKVPAEHLTVDRASINTRMRGALREYGSPPAIPGVRFFQEEQMTVRSR